MAVTIEKPQQTISATTTVQEPNNNEFEPSKCPLYYQPSPHYPRVQMRPDIEMDPELVKQATERIRARILQLNKENPDRFSQRQLDRVRSCDFEIRRFLYQTEMDEKEAERMLVEKLEYGRELDYDNAHDLRFPKEFYQIGGVFEYEVDSDGAPTVYMRAKLHRKIPVLQDVVKKFLLYKMSKIDQQHSHERTWAIVFDMQGVSLSNVDFDLLLFLVKAVKDYFPWSIRYIAVVELPWMMQTIWKALEKLMPDTSRRLIFMMDRKRLNHVISPSNLPDFLGGTCKTDYCRAPEGALPAEIVGAKELNLTPKEIQDLMVHFAKFLPQTPKTKK